MDGWVMGVFLVVYGGMILGGIPGLSLDRTGIALLGAIALVVPGRLSVQEALGSVDVPTMVLLFGLMVVSAQLRLGGFYTWVVLRFGGARIGPKAMLGGLVLTAGVLSALLANDVVCLAMTPVLIEVCSRRGWRPVPFLLALAAAANVGSAATLIGNPQNMLIGQALHLSFAGYLIQGGVPALLGLGVVWAVVVATCHGRFDGECALSAPDLPPFHRWQSIKGLLVLGGLLVLFLVEPVPRELVALLAAAILMTSRKMASRQVLGLVDWQLLVLFLGLFVVNHAMQESGLASRMVLAVSRQGVDLSRPGWLFGTSVVLSNLVSNVPAVMLLLPMADHPLAGPVLALSSTLAGNLLLVGSIANLIVVDQAGRLGVSIGWKDHARVGIPVTLGTLVIAALWLWAISPGRAG